MYVALGSNCEDGRSWIHEALQQGAVAVLAELAVEDLPEKLPWESFAYARVLNASSAWFWLCKNFGLLCKLGTVLARIDLLFPGCRGLHLEGAGYWSRLWL
jgi:hypothetical protein